MKPLPPQQLSCSQYGGCYSWAPALLRCQCQSSGSDSTIDNSNNDDDNKDAVYDICCLAGFMTRLLRCSRKTENRYENTEATRNFLDLCERSMTGIIVVVKAH